MSFIQITPPEDKIRLLIDFSEEKPMNICYIDFFNLNLHPN